MDNDQLPFHLYLSGYEIGDPSRRTPFEQVHHFPTLESALAALLQIDPQCYIEPVARRNQASHFYRAAQILPPGTRESLFEIMVISFEDAPEATPPAGVYLLVSENVDLRTLPVNEPIAFNEFSYYDPDGPFVQLAAMTYENRLNVTPDKTLAALQKSLPPYPLFELQMLYQDFHDRGERRYPDAPYQLVFHYEDMHAAMAHLLRQDIRAIHPDVAEYHQLTGMIHELNLFAPTRERLFSVVAFTEADAKEDNGIYLLFHQSSDQLQAVTGMDPALFLRREDASPYLKLLHFTGVDYDIYPDRNFYQLARNFLGNQMEDVLQKYARPSPYLLISEPSPITPPTGQSSPEFPQQQFSFFYQAVKQAAALCEPAAARQAADHSRGHCPATVL